MVGFINGGRDSSFPFSRASKVTLTSFCYSDCQSVFCKLHRVCGNPYLAIFKLEGKKHLVAIDLFLCDLRSNPAFGGIGLPGSRTNIIVRGHVLWRGLGPRLDMTDAAGLC